MIYSTVQVQRVFNDSTSLGRAGIKRYRARIKKEIRNSRVPCQRSSHVLDPRRTRRITVEDFHGTSWWKGGRFRFEPRHGGASVARPGSFWLIGQYSLLAPRGSCITRRDVEKLPDWDALINNPRVLARTLARFQSPSTSILNRSSRVITRERPRDMEQAPRELCSFHENHAFIRKTLPSSDCFAPRTSVECTLKEWEDGEEVYSWLGVSSRRAPLIYNGDDWTLLVTLLDDCCLMVMQFRRYISTDFSMYADLRVTRGYVSWYRKSNYTRRLGRFCAWMFIGLWEI